MKLHSIVFLALAVLSLLDVRYVRADSADLWESPASKGSAGYNRVLNAIKIKKPVTKQFVQQKKMVSLGRTLNSKGLIYISPDGICWKTTEPFVSSMKISKEGIEQQQADGKREFKHSRGSMQVKYMVKIMLAMFIADMAVLEQEFDLFFLKSGSSWRLGLKPKRKMIKKVFSSVIISGSKSVEKIVIKQPGGDESQIDMSNSDSTELTLMSCVK